MLVFSAFSSVHDFFHSSSWYLLRNLSIFAVVLLWLGLGFWVFQDARRRIEDPWLVGMAVLVAVFIPFMGPVIYLLFRPHEYIEDRRLDELERQEIEERLAAAKRKCPVCQAETESGFLVCPICKTRLRQPCDNCGRPLEPAWQACPYCEHEVAGAAVVALRPQTSPGS